MKMESENLSSKIKIIKINSSSSEPDHIILYPPTLTTHSIEHNQNESVESDTSDIQSDPNTCEPRRPTTRKEIKFFGTEIFDEKNYIKKSPKKFLPRACSFGEKYYSANFDGGIRGGSDKSRKQNIISSSLPSSFQRSRRRLNHNRSGVNEKLKNLNEKFLDNQCYDNEDGRGGGGNGVDDDYNDGNGDDQGDDDEFDEKICCEGVNEKRKVFRRRTTSICFVDEISDVMLSTSTSSSSQR